MARGFGASDPKVLLESLRNQALQDLARSGLGPDDFAKLKLEPLPAGSEDSLGERHGYKIPYFDRDGKPKSFYRERFLERVGDDDPKYLQAKGSGQHIYLPPYVDWRKIFADPKVELWITEGEKKAATATKLGFPTVGLGGVDNIGGKMPGGLLPELLELAKGNRPITVIFDADIDAKPDVQRARTTLLERLAQAGADAGFADLDPADGKGLDDFVMRQGTHERAVAALRKLGQSRQLIYPQIVITPVPAEWFKQPPPPDEWIWHERIMKGTNTVIAGPGAVGKTQFLLKVLVGIATGNATLAGADLVHGAVVMISGEDGTRIIRKRLWNYRQRALEAAARELAAKRISKREYEDRIAKFERSMSQNFHLLCLAGGELHLLDTTSGEVKQSGTVAPLIGRIKAVAPQIVVFDPMTRFHGGDENANALGTGMVNVMERIAEQCDTATVLSHHVNKAAIKEGDAMVTAVRGASAIVDGARSVFTLTKADESAVKKLRITYHDEQWVKREVTSGMIADDRLVLLKHVKSNHAALARDVFWVRGEHGLLIEGHATSGTPEDQYQRRLTALRSVLFGATFTKSVAWNKAKEGSAGLTRQAVEATIDEAAGLGDLVIDDAYKAKNPAGKGFKFADTSHTPRILPE